MQRRQLRKIEDIDFYLGGPGHSGTTWLNSMIRQHPDIFIPPESNFLTWRHRTHSITSFFGSEEAMIFGEHGNNYFSFEGVPDKLAAIAPAAKLIFAIQDPFERIMRNYRHDLMYGVVPRFFSLEALLQENLMRNRYITPSRYADNVRRWLDRFPAEQIFLYWIGKGDRKESLRKVFSFLGAKPFEPENVDTRKNESVIPLFPTMHREATFGRSRMAKMLDPLNSRLGKTFVGPPKIRQSDLDEVKELLGDQFSLEPLLELAAARGISTSV